MKTKLFALLLAFLSIVQYVSAQTENEDNYKHWKDGLGFAVGFSTGWGLSYRHLFNKFGIQTTLGPYVTNDNATVSGGITFIYNLVKTDKTSFYLYQGNNLLYTKSTENVYDPITNTYSNEKKTSSDTELINGLGIGIEIVTFDRVGLNFMGGYAGYNSFQNVSFTGELAAFYRF